MSIITIKSHYTVNQYKQPMFIQEYFFENEVFKKTEVIISWENMKKYADGQFVDTGDKICQTTETVETNEYDEIISKIKAKKEAKEAEIANYTDIEAKVAKAGYNPKSWGGAELVKDVERFLSLPKDEQNKDTKKFNKFTLRKIFEILGMEIDF